MTVASLMERLKTAQSGTSGTSRNVADVPQKTPLPRGETGFGTSGTCGTSQKAVAENKAAPAPTTGEGQPLPKFHSAQPWNALDRAFQAHYWQCPACKVAGRTRGPLCPQGQQLSAAVDQAFAAT